MGLLSKSSVDVVEQDETEASEADEQSGSWRRRAAVVVGVVAVSYLVYRRYSAGSDE